MNTKKNPTETLANALRIATSVFASSLAGCGGCHSAAHVSGVDDDPGYSIWIMSGQGSQEVFQEKIREIASTFRGAAGPFQPHVTLLGHVQGSEADVLEKTRSLAQSMAPFGMHLLGYGTTDERFKQLFIQIDRDRNITAARAAAEKAFGKTEPGEYMPHLSLAYGNLEPDAKARIMSAEKGLLDCGYEAKALAVARTPDELKDWKLIGVFPLAKPLGNAPAP